MHVLTYVHKKKCTRERVRRKHFPSQRCNKAISTYTYNTCIKNYRNTQAYSYMYVCMLICTAYVNRCIHTRIHFRLLESEDSNCN